MDDYHTPVLLKEAIGFLNVKEGEKFIDATLGGGGHSLEILRRGGILLGIDLDSEALEYVEENWKKEDLLSDAKFTLAKGNFADLKELAEKNGFKEAAGIIFDLGVSTFQLKTDRRGFSFKSQACLDMRMDSSQAVAACDLVNILSGKELYDLFKKYGEEFHSRAVARAIVRARTVRPIKTCRELAEIVLGAGGEKNKIFQALRIAVNDELNNLKKVLPQAAELLKEKGRLVVISYHSLEDRIVKFFFKDEEKKGVLEILTDKPIRPGIFEISENPRARSGKLRASLKK